MENLMLKGGSGRSRLDQIEGALLSAESERDCWLRGKNGAVRCLKGAVQI